MVETNQPAKVGIVGVTAANPDLAVGDLDDPAGDDDAPALPRVFASICNPDR